MIFGQRSADIRIVFEAEKCFRIHGHKTFKELLITVEELVIDFDIVAPFNFLEILLGVLLRVEVFLCELILPLLFLVSSVYDRQTEHRVHLTRQVIGLGPVIELFLQHRHPCLQFLVPLIVYLINTFESILRIK